MPTDPADPVGPAGTVTIERRGNLAAIRIVNLPVNALNNHLRALLDRAFDTLIADPAVHGVLITGANGRFVAGADINELSQGVQPPYLGDMLRRAEAAPKPFIAAIQGAAMGGGLEIALACTRRLAAASARFALPELKLGLIPGAGGTQRLPRLIGLEPALDLLLTSRTIGAGEALQLGLIDRIIDGDVEEAAWEELTNPPPPAPAQTACPDVSQIIAARRQMLAANPALAALPAAWKLLDAVNAAFSLPPAEGFAAERSLFTACRASSEAHALLQHFVAGRAAARLARHPT